MSICLHFWTGTFPVSYIEQIYVLLLFHSFLLWLMSLLMLSYLFLKSYICTSLLKLMIASNMVDIFEFTNSRVLHHWTSHYLHIYMKDVPLWHGELILCTMLFFFNICSALLPPTFRTFQWNFVRNSQRTWSASGNRKRFISLFFFNY